MKAIIVHIVILFLLFAAFISNAQDATGDAALSGLNNGLDVFPDQPDTRVLLALSSLDYPVTPGDVYRLSYIGSQGYTSMDVTILSDNTLNLGLFGSISTAGLTYSNLGKEVHSRLSKAYPDSSPQFLLKSTGIFQVLIQGEVNEAAWVNCWGLSRLSGVIHKKTTPYASLRDIEIVSASGKSHTCDLFLALRYGKIDQDPYVKPQDRLIIKRSQCSVKLAGEVYRPGVYQLLPGEGLKALIDFYGSGFTGLSESGRISIIRRKEQADKPASAIPGQAVYISALSKEYGSFALSDLDEVYVPSKKESRAVVYFEGALLFPPEPGDSNQRSSGKLSYQIVSGEKLSSAVRAMYSRFQASANLRDAYIVRNDSPVPVVVDIENLIHDYREENDIVLLPYDRIVIPSTNYFVTVSGAVRNPGKYPYVPDRTFLFYIELAGGCEPEKNSDNKVLILDRDDKKQPANRIILPDDRIVAEYNNPLYHLNQWSAVIGTTISLATLVFSIIQLTQ